MTIVTGVVANANDNFGKCNILVNGVWYSTKAEWAPKIRPVLGDSVEFDDGGSKYLKNCRITSSGGGVSVAPTAAGASAGGYVPKSKGGFQERTFPVAPLAPERTINRQNALTAAVNYHTNIATGSNREEIIETARYFEAYTTGDLDLADAQEAIAAFNP